MQKLFGLSAKILAILAMVFVLNTALNPQFAGADAKSEIQGGINQASGGTSEAQQKTNLDDTITTIVNVLSTVTGVIAVIMIIIAGYRYITSGGASDKVTSAKNTILYAIIGLVVVALAQVIVRFVLNKATSAGP